MIPSTTRHMRAISLIGVLTGLLVLLLVSAHSVGAEDTGTADDVTVSQESDTTAPILSSLTDVVVEAHDAAGSAVHYGSPGALDDRDGVLVPVCTPVSGSLFPLGTTAVMCAATDSAGNRSEIVALYVTVRDSTPPALTQPPDLRVPATNEFGASVSFAAPITVDAVSGPLASSCTPPSGSTFSIGTTVVTCSATDAAGNAASVSFTVTVDPLPIEEPTVVPTPVATAEPSPTQEPTATIEPSPEVTPTPAALGLPWPPPPPVNPIYGSGPIDGLAVIWGGLSFPISQEYGHTLFSLSQPTLYLYGTEIGLDGRAHPGLDIGMGRGTYLYSPVNGTVVAAGGTGGFGFYGNTLPGVGELRIETAEGHQVILGHMAAIAVYPGDQVTTGQFVGLSGGDNGDHLHLETRHASGAGFVAVDPRLSFLIPSLTAFNSEQPEPSESPGDDSVAEPEAEFLIERPAEFDAGISDGNESVVESVPSESPQHDHPGSGISDGNGEVIEQSAPEASRRNDEPTSISTFDPSRVLESVLNPPAAPIEATKRSATETLVARSRD